MTFVPVYKDYPWGGSRIPETYHRNVSGEVFAESWEISDHDDGMSIVSSGPLAGKTFRELLQKNPQNILGTKVHGSKFPLLIKLIDAKKKLSVQVHPNNATAAEFGGEAKTEMWYMLGDNPAQVYYGLNSQVTRESFIQSIKDKTTAQTMHAIPVEKGNCIFVPGGKVHAIDADCLMLEVQQNSNTTYRIYDWDRMGNDGKPRDLHIDQAINAINWDDHTDPLIKPKTLTDTDQLKHDELMQCEYFKLEKLAFKGSIKTHMDGTTFHALFITDGTAEISWDNQTLNVDSGTSVLIPAALPNYTLNGNATVLRTTIP